MGVLLALLLAQTNPVLFVSPTGSDLNPCTAEGDAGCATVNGALSKLPKIGLGNAVVKVAAGTYPCFQVGGFIFNPLGQVVPAPGGPTPGGSGIAIVGTMVPAALDGGSTSGAVSSFTTGTIGGVGVLFNTVTDSTASWAPSNLKGRWLLYTSGTRFGSRWVIYDNTATTITLLQGNNLDPAVGDTFRIEEPGTVVNTTCNTAPDIGIRSDGGYLSTSYPAAIAIGDNFGEWSNTLKLSNIRLENPTGVGILIRSANRIALEAIQGQYLANTFRRVVIERNTGGVTVMHSAFRHANTTDEFQIMAHGPNEPWPINYGLILLNVLCEGGRACVSASTQAAMYTVAVNPLTNFGMIINGQGGNLIRGMRCEANTKPATACIRVGDSDARGWCTQSLSLQSSTFNGDYHADGLNVNGKCVIDVYRMNGHMDAGYGISVNMGAFVPVWDSVTTLSGSQGDIGVLDAEGWGGKAASYSLSEIRTTGALRCTPPGYPFGSVVCVQP